MKGGSMHVLKWLFDELADEDGILLDNAYYAFKCCARFPLVVRRSLPVCCGGETRKSGDVEIASRGRILQDMAHRRSLGSDAPVRVERWTCTAAAGNGHLDVLRWAFENGCPANENVIRRAKVIGREDIEQWALANHLPEPNGDNDSWMSEDIYDTESPIISFANVSDSD